MESWTSSHQNVLFVLPTLSARPDREANSERGNVVRIDETTTPVRERNDGRLLYYLAYIDARDRPIRGEYKGKTFETVADLGVHREHPGKGSGGDSQKHSERGRKWKYDENNIK